MSDMTNYLDELVLDLYRRAAGAQVKFGIPIKVVDSPVVADEIFKNHELFVKNYAFFEKLSKGRLSSSGGIWEKRAKLTQAFYHQSTHKLSDEDLMEIYIRNLDAPLKNNAGTFRKALIRSATEVIFLSYGFRPAFPWSEKVAEEISKLLREEQFMAWTNPGYDASEKNTSLIDGYRKIKELWNEDSQATQFLNNLSSAATDIPNFDAMGELIQNIFAAIETTASAVMWAVDVLGRNPQYAEDLRNDIDGKLEVFIDEVLRLYPPLPFVTRVVGDDCKLSDVEFTKGEHILISIVGINCHKNYWQDALLFKFPRPEFIDNTYENIAFRPFISGPRVCAGMKLAKRELKASLTAILHLFKIKEINVPLALEHGLTCMPRTTLENFLEYAGKK